MKGSDTFEIGVKKLEEVIKILENGNSTLDETLALYEEGIRLYRFCNDKLDKAEQKITIMMNETEEAFHISDGDEHKGD